MDVDTLRSLSVFEDKTTRTTKNQRDSPLLRLPAELRNKVYDLVCSNTQVRVRRPRFFAAALGRHHQGALALLSTCRQLRHETFSTFHTMAVFEVSTSTLDQLKKSNVVLNSDLWNSIQSIQMRGNEVEDWCYFAGIYNGKSLGESGGDDMYIGFLPSLQHVIVVNHVDEGEERYGYSHHEIADTLELAFGKSTLSIHIQEGKCEEDLFRWID